MEEKIVSIWCSYTEQANELTNKRFTNNSIFLAATAALLGISIPYLGMTSLAVSSVGILMSVVWLLMIISFKHLSASKFAVIEMLENKMSIKPYGEEWLEAKKRKYIKLTTIEIITSIVVGLGFAALVIISILKIQGKI